MKKKMKEVKRNKKKNPEEFSFFKILWNTSKRKWKTKMIRKSKNGKEEIKKKRKEKELLNKKDKRKI